MNHYSSTAIPAVVAALVLAISWTPAAAETTSQHIALGKGDAVSITVTRSAVEAPAATPAAAETPAAKAGSSDAHPIGNMGLLFFVFVLAIFLGFELIAKVPSQLHTPLMSGSNAISGISIVGALLAVHSENQAATLILGTLAVAFAMINVVGGYTVTDRMLGMFTHKKESAQ